MVRAINSRFPVYKASYGDGLCDLVQSLLRRIARKAIPIAKQLSMNHIDVVRDKAPCSLCNVAGRALLAIKARLARLIRRKPKPVKLRSSNMMPVNVSKII